MFRYTRSFTRLLVIIVSFFLLGFLGLSYLLGVSYGAEITDLSGDERAALIDNHPLAAESATVSGNLDPNAQLDLRIRLALHGQAALDELIAEQQDPRSAKYHRWLKSGEFFERFGPSKTEIDAVTQWLRDEGFEVKGISAGYLDFRGSVEQAQRTFEVRIARFGAADAYGNLGDPYIPARFSNVIAGVIGLDNMTHAMAMGRLLKASSTPDAVVSGAQAFGPADFYSFYDENPVPGSDGAGDCVAIVGTSDFLDTSMRDFTTQFGIAPINYTRVIQGSNPGINGAEIEADIDLQWAHSAAPGAAISYYLGSDLVGDISAAVSDNQCGAISISYGFCGPSPAFINGVIHPLFQQAAAQGQSVFVASGDQGAAGLGYNPVNNSCVLNNSPSVNEMSADPNVTSVGGTQFSPKYVVGNDRGFVPEAVWNDGSGAAGGGASEVFAKPSWQTGVGVPDDGARDVPDLALMASPSSPGVFIGYDSNGTAQVVCCAGGTSLSTPMMAGLSRTLAEIVGQTRLGNLGPILYQLANQNYATSGFRDVTVGNNGMNGLAGFNAVAGYDQASGWGSIDFRNFASAIKALLNPQSMPTLTPTVTPSPATPSPTATATPSAGILSVPASLNFPATATGRPGSMKPLMIRNLSRTSTLTAKVGSLAAPFSVSGNGQYSIAPGANATVSILFSPTQSGIASGSLQITSSDAKHANAIVKVSARVQGGRLSAPTRVSMSAPLDGEVTRTVMLRNSGAGTLAGTVQAFAPGSPFSLLGGSVSFQLAPHQSQPVTIAYKAMSTGSAEAALLVAMSDPAGIASLSVTGSTK